MLQKIVESTLLVAALLLIQFMPKAALADSCWVKSACESTGGVWDSEHQNQLPCTKFGEQATAKCFVKVPDITLQVAIPGLSDRDAEGRPVIKGGFPAYMAAFYKFFVAALVVIAVGVVMWGGFKRIMAAGSPERVKSANETIIGAITGVVIALISYSLLSLVNPNLVKNFGLNIEKIKPESYGDKCPKYDDARVIYDGGYVRVNGVCSGGRRAGKPCETDAGCTGSGTCVGKDAKFVGSPSFDTCGSELDFGGHTCRGMEGTKIRDTGCFGSTPRGGSSREYECEPFIVTGNFQESNLATDEVDLMLVCYNDSLGENKALNCDVGRAGSDVGENSINVSGQSSYAIGKCFESGLSGYQSVVPTDWCTNKGGFKGYALIVEPDVHGDYYMF